MVQKIRIFTERQIFAVTSRELPADTSAERMSDGRGGRAPFFKPLGSVQGDPSRLSKIDSKFLPRDSKNIAVT
jgi:hypothetical protein